MQQTQKFFDIFFLLLLVIYFMELVLVWLEELDHIIKVVCLENVYRLSNRLYKAIFEKYRNNQKDLRLISQNVHDGGENHLKLVKNL